MEPLTMKLIGGVLNGSKITVDGGVYEYRVPLLREKRDEVYHRRTIIYKIGGDEWQEDEVFVVDGMTDDEAYAEMGFEQKLCANFGGTI